MKNLNKKIKCYDSGEKYIDRYTVVFLECPEREKGTYSAVGMSEYPFSPQGFGQHTTAAVGRHLGKKIDFNALPEDCKKLVLRDLEDIAKNTEQTGL